MSHGPGELVFVYGTLRRGGSNAFRMDGAEFVAPGKVAGSLYAISWYPGLVVGGGGETVDGDLFRVPAGQLAALDEFEGISANEIEGAEYRRVKAGVATDDGRMLSAWVYEWIGPVEESKRIPSGDWLEAGC
jgi:gamma-glutamylaminecyclotransferase